MDKPPAAFKGKAAHIVGGVDADRKARGDCRRDQCRAAALHPGKTASLLSGQKEGYAMETRRDLQRELDQAIDTMDMGFRAGGQPSFL